MLATPSASQEGRVYWKSTNNSAEWVKRCASISLSANTNNAQQCSPSRAVLAGAKRTSLGAGLPSPSRPVGSSSFGSFFSAASSKSTLDIPDPSLRSSVSSRQLKRRRGGGSDTQDLPTLSTDSLTSRLAEMRQLSALLDSQKSSSDSAQPISAVELTSTPIAPLASTRKPILAEKTNTSKVTPGSQENAKSIPFKAAPPAYTNILGKTNTRLHPRNASSFVRSTSASSAVLPPQPVKRTVMTRTLSAPQNVLPFAQSRNTLSAMRPSEQRATSPIRESFHDEEEGDSLDAALAALPDDAFDEIGIRASQEIRRPVLSRPSSPPKIGLKAKSRPVARPALERTPSQAAMPSSQLIGVSDRCKKPFRPPTVVRKQSHSTKAKIQAPAIKVYCDPVAQDLHPEVKAMLDDGCLDSLDWLGQDGDLSF